MILAEPLCFLSPWRDLLLQKKVGGSAYPRRGTHSWLLFGLFMLATAVWAGDSESFVDLYGLDSPEANRILQKYAARVRSLEMRLLPEYEKEKPNIIVLTHLLGQKKQLVKAIQREGSFAFVDLQTVVYPQDKSMYTTIEVVPRRAVNRLHFISQEAKAYPHPPQPDLVEEMMRYEHKTFQLMMDPSLILDKTVCPVYHCLTSFTHPELKPYLALFNKGMLRDKQKVIATLQHDPNPERRAAAAFLIGHCQNAHDIIHILLPHVTDSNSGVRNNVLRVIAATIAKDHLTQLDPTPFLVLLHSPYVTDRNKALSILLTIADSPVGKAHILKHGGDDLLNLLRLRQPNNHNLAYGILKKISNQSYGEYQAHDWQTWLAHHQGQSSIAIS